MAEFNFYADPEAVKIVMKSGLKISITPLDVGLKALVLSEDSDKK